MKRSTRITLILSAVWMALISIAPAAHAEPQKDAILDMLPADTLFCVRINQFNASLGKMDQYLMGASPMPVSLAMLVGMQMAGIVGDPMLTGIDRDGTFALVGIGLPNNRMDMSVLVPMTDYETFVKSNPSCKPSEQAGITLLEAPNSPVGAIALMPVAGSKYAIVNSVEFIDAMVTLGQQLQAKTGKLSTALDAEQTAQAATAPVWAYVNVSRLYELYGPMLQEGIDEAMQEMSEQAALSDAMNVNRQMALTMVQTLFGQADSITLAMTPEQALLSVDAAFKAKKGTELAAMLVADPQTATSFSLAGLADDRDAFNAVFKMNRPLFDKLNALMLTTLSTGFGDKWSDADKTQLKSLVEKTTKAMGKEGFVSFSYGAGQPPFALREVLSVTEPDFMKTTAEQGLGVANTLYKAMDMPFTLGYEPNTETHANVPIGVVKMTLTDTEDESAKMMVQLYGENGLSYYTAQKDNLLYITMGPEGKNAIKALIDAPAGKPASGDLQKAMTILGPSAEKADMVAGINYLKAAKGFMGMASQMGGEEIPPMFGAMAAAMDVPTQSCLAASATVADGKIASRFVLPKQHLAEIMTAIMKVQQIVMQEQQQQMQMQQQQPPLEGDGPRLTTPKADPLQEWVGKAVPAVVLTDLQGSKINLAELKGKKVVLDFWATWCPPCKKMIPDLIALRKEVKAEQLVIVGVSDEPLDRLNKYIKDNQINYPIAMQNYDLPSPFDQVVSLPTTFFIDSTGVIRQVLVGYHSLDEMKAILNEMK